ncbi:MAG: hypothetical protein K2K14_02690 [Ruminococcus sp.]|nr:hypothetical protein [Ruminococcus sp.]
MEPDDENYLRSIIDKDGTDYKYETLVREWQDGKLVPHHREVHYKLYYKDYIDMDGVIFRRDYNYKKISVDDVDFDFDGYNDLYIPDYDDEKGTYYRYSPDTEKFEAWDELNKISLPLTVDGNCLKYHTSDIMDNDETVFYEWLDKSISQSQRIVTYTAENGERYIDYFDSKNVLFKRERTVFNEYGIISGTEEILTER